MTRKLALRRAPLAVCDLATVLASIHSLELKNDLPTALALRGARNRGFDFAKWIRLFDSCFEQTAPSHVEKGSKGLHPLRWTCIIVPFVDPDAAKSQVFENEKTRWNFQRLQAHRAEAHQRAARSETIGQPQRAIAAD